MKSGQACQIGGLVIPFLIEDTVVSSIGINPMLGDTPQAIVMPAFLP